MCSGPERFFSKPKKASEILISGEVAEWLKATVSKTVILGNRDRGFESHPLRSFRETPFLKFPSFLGELRGVERT
jgi:hypothetical protein